MNHAKSVVHHRQALLDKIHFDPRKDQLGFVGDLVNRGPRSLQTLQFIATLKNPLIVLGNHDLHMQVLTSSDNSAATCIVHCGGIKK